MNGLTRHVYGTLRLQRLSGRGVAFICTHFYALFPIEPAENGASGP